MDRLTSRILQQKHSSYKCQFCTKVSAFPLSLRQVLAEYNVEVPDVSDSHGTLCNSTPELQNFKICVSKLQKATKI